MHILILGAGYAGLHAALKLDRLLAGRRNQTQITLVERNSYHQHVIQLHLVATAMINPSDAALPLHRILERHAVRLCQGQVTQIELSQRQVLLNNELSLPYDRLVIALGGQTNYAQVPGAYEHTWTLRTYTEALQLHNHIVDCFRTAARTNDPATRRVLLTFVIVGGGFTGCQLAGELAAWVRTLCREYRIPTREVRIALLERAGTLLARFGSWATQEAERVLDQRGISLHLNTQVERVEEQAVFLGDNKYIRSATIIWAAGIRAPQLLTASGLPTDERGRVLVDRYLRVIDHSLIFAAGDSAAIPDPPGGTIPATASYALRQGEHLATTLLAEATGQAPRPYEPLRLGELVSLGPGQAVGNPLGVPSSGLPVALLKQVVERWYVTTLY